MFSELTTPRLVLRPLRPSDSTAVFAYRSDPAVARFQMWKPSDEAEVRTFIEGLQDLPLDTPDTWYQLAITLRDSGVLIGDSGLHFPREKPHQVEVGITLALTHQGQVEAKMRRGVDYIGVGVGAVIVDQQGRLFLARRGPLAKNERGLWEFPGGSVEFGETLAQALRREMREEYGIEIAVGELLDVVDHILPEEGQHWVSPAFVCSINSGEPQIREPAKCSEIGWFRPDQVPRDLTQITWANLAHYRERAAKSRP